MRVAIYGSGGVGGYFGARLAAAGHEVHFIARGAHLDAIRKNGLRVESGAGDLLIRPAQATDNPANIGKVDAVMFAVKLWDVEAAARQLDSLLHERTVVIPFQNGIEAPDMVGKIVGKTHVAGGVAYIATGIKAPGVILHTGTMQRLLVGPGAGEFARACKGAGLNVEQPADIDRARWEKFVFLVGLSSATSVARAPVGVVRADPDLRWLLEETMRETWRLGRQRGISLADDFVDERMRFVDTLHADMRTSMQHDLENGARLEAPWLCGAVARMSAERGLQSSVNRAVFAALKPYVDGRRS